MGKLTHAMVHCSYTKAIKSITADDILQWHLGPKDLKDSNGKRIGVRYKGKTYKDRMDLPVEKIAGASIFTLRGNGWSKPGYSDVIERSGSLISLIGYDDDDWVESWEITNGASGWNGRTRHVCLIGGKANNGKDTEDNFTNTQYVALEAWVKATVRNHSKIKLIGHNQVNKTKGCPGFNVPVWGRKIGLDKRNLDFHNYAGGTYFKLLSDV